MLMRPMPARSPRVRGVSFCTCDHVMHVALYQHRHPLLATGSNVPCRVGAYTTARTHGRTKIFDLTYHVNRLAETARLMAQEGAPATDAQQHSEQQCNVLSLQ